MDNSFKCEVQADMSLAANAKDALEQVCSGKGLDSPSRYYSREFVDHVNDMKFLGLEDARKSVALYTRVLSDLNIVVEEQLTTHAVLGARSPLRHLTKPARCNHHQSLCTDSYPGSRRRNYHWAHRR